MASVTTAIQRENTQAKNIMIFILVMSLAGLANLFAEIIPTIEIGPIEIGISSFWFVAFALVAIFPYWWAALAVPIGELVFADLIMGQFGGLAELEEVILVTIALLIAVRLIKDTKNGRQVLIAALIAYAIAEVPATIIDMAKVWVGVEDFEAVAGLPASIFAIETIDLAIEYIVTGVLFGALPAMWLVPALSGRIEPLMGLRPLRPEERKALGGTTATILLALGALVAGATAIAAEAGFTIFEWEGAFLDSMGEWWIWVGIGAAAVVAVIVLMIRASSKNDSQGLKAA